MAQVNEPVGRTSASLGGSVEYAPGGPSGLRCESCGEPIYVGTRYREGWCLACYIRDVFQKFNEAMARAIRMIEERDVT